MHKDINLCITKPSTRTPKNEVSIARAVAICLLAREEVPDEIHEMIYETLSDLKEGRLPGGA